MAFDAKIIDERFFVTLVMTAVVTSLFAGGWFRYVLNKGWPLLRVRGETLRDDEAEAGADAPLAAVMPQIPDGCHRHPLLQAYLLQEEMPPSGLTFGGARAELVRVPPANAVPEITLELWPHPAVGGVLRYRTDAIDETDARRLAGLLIDNVREIVHALEED